MKISVCLATFNGDRFLEEQISSILHQLSNCDELIISDDGSTDKSIDIINGFNDGRIKLLHNQNSRGVNANFNNALMNATGDYVFLADQDDIWLDDKVKTCIRELQCYDCVIHDAYVVDENKKVLADSFFKLRRSGKGFWKNIYANTYLGCCMAFRKEILQDILPIPITKAFYHDDWIGSIADVKYRLGFIPFKGILFRRYGNNTSSTAGKSKFSFMQKIKNRYIRVHNVCKRLNFNFAKIK